MLTIDSGVTVTISSLTITGGSSFEGAGIDNGGSVTLTGGSHISGNTAGGDGGGIYNFGGTTVTLTGGSHISGNEPDNCAPPGSVPGCSG